MKAFFAVNTSPCPIPFGIFCRDYTGTWVCFDIPARIIRIARLVPFDEFNLAELLRLPSFLMLVKQCEDSFANTLLPILQSKFGSAEFEPFAHFQRMKHRTNTTGNMNGSFLT